MKEDSYDRSRDSIDKEIKELEDAYAECLKDNMDIYTLNRIWARIKALRQELEGGND